SKKNGKLRGRGIGYFLEEAAVFNDRMVIRFDPSGMLTILAGTHSHGQGHETVYAQMVSEWLGVPFETIRFVQGDTDRALPLTAVARAFYRPAMLPAQFDVGLEASGTFAAEPPNYPNGCHLCEVEVDPETGGVTLARYAAVDDVGKIMNHLLCEGQIHGGVAQGVGQALMEAIVFDAGGQLVTGSFQDYAMPRADDFPELVSELTEVPATTNPL